MILGVDTRVPLRSWVQRRLLEAPLPLTPLVFSTPHRIRDRSQSPGLAMSPLSSLYTKRIPLLPVSLPQGLSLPPLRRILLLIFASRYLSLRHLLFYSIQESRRAHLLLSGTEEPLPLRMAMSIMFCQRRRRIAGMIPPHLRGQSSQRFPPRLLNLLLLAADSAP